MLLALLAGLAVAVVAAVVAQRAAALEASREAQGALERARAEAASAVRAAEQEQAAAQRMAETAARTAALEQRAAADEALARDERALDEREATVVRRQGIIAEREDTIAAREEAIDAAQRDVQARRDRALGLETDATQRSASARSKLEELAGVGAAELVERLGRTWLEEARARAAAQIRSIEQTAADPAHDREAKRVMEIAGARFRHHYLTERAQNHLRVGGELVAILLDNNAALHAAIQTASGVTIHVNDDKDALRLDSLDGVGKELVRRALHRFVKKPESIDDARKDPEAWAARAKDNMTQELRTLGKRAFQTLEIPKAHPEIIELVGALNFRTSYTQNQWWHAVEAAYLAGMMAAEMGLDEKLARRATLMHDIGKALTHKIEGSHAVIGADVARRVGESELIANCIGSHHADEPANSVYAYLVAASDAMSGARPGARRELAEGFTAKVEDLERIGFQRRGVAHAHAVHGGRELRVYVREGEVDDLGVVEMSTEIATQVADQMTFPGQIKVTVIRSFEATSTAN